MFTRQLKLAAAALAFAFAAAAPAAVAQQPTPAPDNYVQHTSFKNRVFEVRHRDPEQLLGVIRLMTSGHKGAGASANRAFRTITVRDFPENLATIEEALKRLDTPEPSRPEVELRIHVLIASNAEGGASMPPPAELRDALNQLQSTLSFKNYGLLTTVLQRAKVTDNLGTVLHGEGSAQIAVPGGPTPVTYRYTYNAQSLSQTTTGTGAPTLQIGALSFQLDGGEIGGKASVRSDVGLREGEKVVVGTAGLRDKALILVVTARQIK